MIIINKEYDLSNIAHCNIQSKKSKVNLITKVKYKNAKEFSIFYQLLLLTKNYLLRIQKSINPPESRFRTIYN